MSREKKAAAERRAAAEKRAAAAARRAPTYVPPKRSVNGWEYAGILVAAGFVAWQLVQAAWMGRMDDMFLEQAEYMYFFDHPVVFLIQLALFLGLAYGVFRWGRSIVGRWRK